MKAFGNATSVVDNQVELSLSLSKQILLNLEERSIFESIMGTVALLKDFQVFD